MKTMKTLMLATVAALTLGAGAAMADGSDVINDYQAAKILSTRQAQPVPLQSGSSDVNSGAGFRFGPIHATPDRGIATVGGDG